MTVLRGLLEIISVKGVDGIPVGLTGEEVDKYCRIFGENISNKFERICDCKHSKDSNFRCYNCGYSDSRKDIVDSREDKE